MKSKAGLVVTLLLTSFFLSQDAKGQAPASINGNGFLIGVTGGSNPFGSYGYYLFLTSDSGSSYQSIGVYAIGDASGTYTYTKTNTTTGKLVAGDGAGGSLIDTITFSSPSSGNFYMTASSYPGAYQSGVFNYASTNAPTSVAGLDVVCSVEDGGYPFAYCGSFTFHVAPNASTYTVAGDGSCVGNSTGSFYYSLANRSTGKLQISDSLAGSATVYLGLATPTSGGFAIVRPGGGYQIGSFSISDPTPPSVNISSPTSTTYSNAQTVTIVAPASDNFNLTRVELYDGTELKASSTGSPYCVYYWTFTGDNNGTHTWTARAYDAAGNMTISSPQYLSVYIDIKPPVVVIDAPADGTIVHAPSVVISGSAWDPTPSSGVDLIEVRLNGGAWMTASHSNSFTQPVTLSLGGNSIEARSHDRAGFYSLIASNFVTFADTNKPTLAISSPVAAQKWSNSVFHVIGTSSDNLAIAYVLYQLNGTGWSLASTTNAWTNWSADLTLQPSNNVLQAYAVDIAGNLSTTTSVSFTYIVTDTLQLQANGRGTISPNYSNAVLQIGKSYSMTATPVAGSSFINWVVSTNWTGGVTNKAATLSFIMRSNLTVQVTFADTNKPTATITAPIANQRTTNTTFKIVGTAADTTRVTNVCYQLNGAGWIPANTTNGWTNWNATAALRPGTNVVDACSTDSSGNNSLVRTVSFFYVVTNRLSTVTNGQGSITPYQNNAWLEIGRRYTNTATALTGHKFVNWVCSTNGVNVLTSTNAALPFLMQSNLTLTANFVDATKPTLTVTNPVANSRFAIPVKKIQGNAGDNVRVAGVYYQLNTNPWALAQSSNHFTNWMAMAPFLMGTNTLKAYSVDLAGNCSLTNSMSFYCSNQFVMQLNAHETLVTGGQGLSLLAATGMTCRIDVSTNLLDWATLTNFVTTNATMNFRDAGATNSSQRFYRSAVQ